MSLLKALATEMATCWVRLLSGQKTRIFLCCEWTVCNLYLRGHGGPIAHKRKVHIKIWSPFFSQCPNLSLSLTPKCLSVTYIDLDGWWNMLVNMKYDSNHVCEAPKILSFTGMINIILQELHNDILNYLKNGWKNNNSIFIEFSTN